MIELFHSKDKCCGCGACFNACPKDAIVMTESAEGYVYPQIDTSKCIECEKCISSCAYQNILQDISDKETYVAVSKNTDLSESASGGLFASIAQEVLKSGGVVFGCSMKFADNTPAIRHICINDINSLKQLQGSKYVQSEIGTSYQDIEVLLKQGREVLFSGTPCQVAGLYGFLGKNYDNLYTLDIICHGVPSQKLFRDYIKSEEEKKKIQITDYKFRDKAQGWKLLGSMKIIQDNGMEEKIFFEPEDSSYYQMFLNSYTYRENCYSCPYASEHRSGNVTIGDYWNIDLVHPELLEENGGTLREAEGVSCMVVNNEHGHILLTKYGSGILKWESSYENASRYNSQLLRPSILKAERKEVLELYQQGYEKVDEWYQKRLKKVQMKRQIRARIPKGIKRAARKVLR